MSNFIAFNNVVERQYSANCILW